MPTLYAMLGLPPDAEVARLRYVYEQAVSAAAHRGDRTRALALSRAFDALPAGTRRAVYPTASGSAVTAAPAAAPARRHSERVPRHRRLRTRRVLAWVVLVPVCVAVGLGVVLRLHLALPTGDPPHAQYRKSGPSVAPARLVDGHRRLVPADAPIDAAGWVDVVCQRRAGGPGYEVRFHRGDIAYCTNGAIPTIVG